MKTCPCNRCTGRKPRLFQASPTHQYARPPRAYEYVPVVPMTPEERRAVTTLWTWSLRQAGVRLSPL